MAPVKEDIAAAGDGLLILQSCGAVNLTSGPIIPRFLQAGVPAPPAQRRGPELQWETHTVGEHLRPRLTEMNK